ncbi:MAG: agmatinase [Methanosarcinaceae archaeon]|nr:agmatinase [Methanosarcinaceae archaeon]
MFFLETFYDAIYEYDESKYVIFGVPYDNTSSFRAGSRWAPNKIREASLNFETYDYYYDMEFTDIPIHDAGNMDPSVPIQDTLDELYLSVFEILNDGKIPIMLGGEHSITYAAAKACAKKIKEDNIEKNVDTDFGYLVLDAHLDLREEYRGVKYNHACVLRNIYTEITENVAVIGARSGSKEEWEFAKENKIPVFTADDVIEYGVKDILKQVNESMCSENIYLSLDMDVLDPAYCQGLGTPEPFGLTSINVRDIIREIAPKTCAFDIVEIAPEYDSGNSAITAAKYVKEYVFSKEK